jgi:nitrogen-specific signal transduction histidine kinase/CheY-like chemotaxis protein
MLAMVTDISARKQADAARAQLEAQLRESQKMQAIGTLAGGIAHDFNNILAAIMGNLALAQQRAGLDGKTLGHLAQINKAAVRARDLVQQILAFSRRKPQRLQIQPLRPLVEDVVRLMRPLLPAGVTLDTDLAAEPLTVAVDATQLAQVVMNLCTNAWHALADQTGHIGIGLARAVLAADTAQQLGLHPGAHAHLQVSDTGIGMDAATQARVFEPFFTTKPVGQGTGLGLSVVHGILATHHGAITVDSAPGQGCCFDVYLPLVAAPPETTSLPAQDTAYRPSPDRQVLYVDDDPVMVMVAQGLLEQAGYRVTAFEDPSAALAALHARPDAVDLVVTDHNMPGLSGLDIARSLRLLRPGLPVVISSGYVSEALLAEAAQAGVREVMQKEYMPEQLVAIVNRLLADPAGRPLAPAPAPTAA